MSEERSPDLKADLGFGSSSEHSAASQQAFDSSPSPIRSRQNSLNSLADPEELYIVARFQLAQGIRPDLSALSSLKLQLSLWDRLEKSIEEEQQLLNLSKAGLICQHELPASSSALTVPLQPLQLSQTLA